jgi:hypothetical protein
VSTVREVTFELLRAHAMTTIFGNPGSTEEPFLKDFPADFRHVLGLHESLVVAMADSFAQATGHAAFVNLHTASGMGNGMGTLVTAWHDRTPLVRNAGQQTRKMLAQEPWRVNRERPSCSGPTSNGASSRRGRKMCLEPSSGRITSPWRRHESLFSSRFRWMIGMCPQSRARPARWSTEANPMKKPLKRSPRP